MQLGNVSAGSSYNYQMKIYHKTFMAKYFASSLRSTYDILDVYDICGKLLGKKAVGYKDVASSQREIEFTGVCIGYYFSSSYIIKCLFYISFFPLLNMKQLGCWSWVSERVTL